MCFDSPGNHLWGEISGKQKANAKHVLLLQGSSASLFCSTDTEEHLQNLDPCSSLDYFQITLSWTQSDRLPVPSCNRWDGRHWTLIAARPKLLQKCGPFVCRGKVLWAEAEVQVLSQSDDSGRTGRRAVAASWRHGLSWSITQQGFCLHPHVGLLPSVGKGWVCKLRSSERQRERNGFSLSRSLPNGTPSITTPSNSAKYQN